VAKPHLLDGALPARPPSAVRALRWPLPALLAWGAAWLVYAALMHLEAPAGLAVAMGALLGAGLAALGGTPWRRVFIAGGFPLSLVASGAAAGVPAWAWLLPLAMLAVLYPLNTWRDAPLFPTPSGALAGLAERVPLPLQPRIVDAGCGLGAGLRELRREYPAAHLEGWEWSWPLRWLCAWRCRDARVRRTDIWAADWSAHDMVYLFQRPESMPRAVAKAALELKPGAWLASMEFEARELVPAQVLGCRDGRSVWLYEAPFRRR